jgi:fucose 4-O-acetylase-like acetyltransferase
MSGEMIDHAPARHVRLDWLDALKGIGILAVVAGHIWTRGPVRDAIYLFHMPLFFIASGFTLRPVPFPRLLRRLGTSLLVPFLTFSLFLLSADFLIEHWRGVRPIFSNFADGAHVILLSTQSTRGPFTILWFVPCLVLARLVWNGLALRWPDPGEWQWPVTILTLLAAAYWWGGTTSPFGLIAVPGALAFLWIGALWRSKAGAPLLRWATLSAGAGSLLAFALLPPLAMKTGGLGIPLLSVAAAFLVTWTLAQALVFMPGVVVSALAALGRMSLVIMYMHVAFIHYFAPYARPAILFVIALAGSMMVDQAARKYGLTRRLLLGARA